MTLLHGLRLVLPFGHPPRPFATLLRVVERLSPLAAVASGHSSIDAHVEELAVVGIRVPGMGQAEGLVHRRAREVEHILRGAALLRRLVGPRADSGLGVEDQAVWAGDHVEFTVDTVEELVADFLVSVAKVSVLPGTVQCGLRLL